MPRILVVEDAPEVMSLVRTELTSLAFDVVTAGDGAAGLAAASQGGVDLVVLDLMLPGMNGLEVLRRLRREGFAAPILLLTARDSEADRVAGLELGADDYVVKPFSLRELSARVAALLRRHTGRTGMGTGMGDAASSTITVLDCKLDEAAATVCVAGLPCMLSQREFALLGVLLRSAGRVLSREWLLEQVWGRDYDGEDRAVDAGVLRLREKLGRGSQIAQAIEAVRGVGYRLTRRGP